MNRLRTKGATIFGVLRQVSGWRGRWAILAAKLRPAAPDRLAADSAIAIRLRGIGPVKIRPRTTDESLIYGHLRMGQHRPPPETAGRPMKQICELGTNIGLGLADLGVRYPGAQLLGVEADPDNAKLARENLSVLGDRCALVEAAIWSSPGEIKIAGDLPGLIAASAEAEDRPGSLSHTVRAITVEELLEAHMPNGPIDYMHFDIVGSEPQILNAGSSWVGRVRSLKIQLYEDIGFRPQECLDLLAALGFEAWVETGAHGKLALAVRRP